jgi:hypothetical protein
MAVCFEFLLVLYGFGVVVVIVSSASGAFVVSVSAPENGAQLIPGNDISTFF